MEKVWIRAVLLAAAPVCGEKANAVPTQCPTVNISILEGSSEIIVPDISGYPNTLVLRQKNHSSSSWKYIANIRNGTLTPYLSAYSAHFSVRGHSLVVGSASRFLKGEYELGYHLDEICLKRVFLDVSGSKCTHYAAVAAAVLMLVLVVLFALWCKFKRGRPAHPSTGVPDTGNESLHPVTMETEETRFNTPSLEYRTAVNGML